MLINFTTENFLSFNESSTLSLTLGDSRLHRDDTIQIGKFNLLKFGAVFGANASGKSNLIHAIGISKSIILSHLNINLTKDIYNKNFSDNKMKNTSFEYEILIDNNVYSYGFSINAEKSIVTKEWLIDITQKEVEVFTREDSININNDYLKLDEKLFKRFEIYAEDTINQKNILFLTYINKLPIKQIDNDFILSKVYNWYYSSLEVISPSMPTKDFGTIYNSDKYLIELSKYLNSNDTGITKVVFEETNDTIRGTTLDVHQSLVDDFKTFYMKNKENGNLNRILKLPGGIYKFVMEDDKIKIFDAKFYHNNIKFNYYEESDGTKRLMELFPIVSNIHENKVFIIDELDRSLHPLLTVNFVKEFILNSSRSQMVITTHQERLLNLSIFRRDQFWFISKDKSGNSSLYSLEEYRERFDKNIMNAYLSGRYGATPDINHYINEESKSWNK